MNLDARFRDRAPGAAELFRFLGGLVALGPRLMGTPGERAARDRLAEDLRDAGLATREHAFTVDLYRRGTTEAVLETLDGPRPLEALAVECSPPTGGEETLELVSVGKGRVADVEAVLDALEGRAAFSLEPSSGGFLRAARAGCRCWFEACSPKHDAIRMAFMPPGRAGVSTPKVKLKASSAAAVQQAFAGRRPPAVRVRVEGETGHARSGNLEAVLPGRTALAPILVGAHLDTFSLSPGAIDNGTGLAAACLLARTFAALGPLRRELRFLLFTGEEDDRRGSKEYVRSQMPPRPGLYFNFDVPLGGPLLLHVMAGEQDDLGFWERLGASLGDPFRFQRNMRRSSDHYSFYRAGVPCLMMRATPETEQEDPAHIIHTVLDTLDRVDLPALARSVNLSGRILLALAESETLPFAPFEPLPDLPELYPDPG